MALWIFGFLPTFWIFNDHLVHVVFIWYIFPVLVSCTKKNLATPAESKSRVSRD
jgi:hypothetical protein